MLQTYASKDCWKNEKHDRFPKDISNPPCCDVTLLFRTFPKLEKLWMILRMLFHLSGVPHLHVNRPLLSSSLKDISGEIIFQVLKKSFGHSRDILAFSYCGFAGRVRDHPGLPVRKYITAASIQVCSSRSMLFFDILFVFNRISERKPKEHTRKLKAQEISCFVWRATFLQAKSMN